MGGSRFKSQWGQKFTYQIKNNNKNKIKAPEHFGGQGMIWSCWKSNWMRGSSPWSFNLDQVRCIGTRDLDFALSIVTLSSLTFLLLLLVGAIHSNYFLSFFNRSYCWNSTMTRTPMVLASISISVLLTVSHDGSKSTWLSSEKKLHIFPSCIIIMLGSTFHILFRLLLLKGWLSDQEHLFM